MSDKFQNKYRIASARTSWWNYGWNGAYFITVCTANRSNYFGEIENGKMKLSSIGILADVLWHEIKNHAENIELGAFVVMPNHIHGILILDRPENVNTDSSVDTGHIEIGHALSISQSNQTPAQQRFRNQGKNTVSSIIGSYKSALTKHCNRLGLTDTDGVIFAWQTRFHDHIIRNNEEYQRINDYIETNIQNWGKDKFFDEK
ncbi:MAG: transposase [Bacteroidetes bacterium]|nr:transposase [Bacteroidota bacterium]